MATNHRQRRVAVKGRTPGSDATLLALAKRHHAAGQLAAAVAGYADVLKLDHKNTDALFGLGSAKLLQGDRRGALRHLTKAIQIDPRSTAARFLLGNVLAAEKSYHNAIQQIRQCVRLEPDNMQYLRYLADLWGIIHEYRKAAECYAIMIAINPDYAVFHNNLGLVNRKEGLIDEAIASLRRAMKLEPSNAKIRSNLLLALNYSSALSRQRIFEEHKYIGGGFPSALLPPFVRSDMSITESRRHLRIGFVSPDFRTHSVSYFFEPVLAKLDRDAFEIFCYAEVRQPDESTARLHSMADHWFSTVGKSDEEVAVKIRGDKIDILIDLAGHTVGNRLPVLATRVAPVQATWLGYPNTTGIPAMDFRISDSICDPAGEADGLATEELVRLPDGFLCYRPNPDTPDICAPPCLSTGFITFGSFNNPAKINEEIVALWADIMRRVPESTFLLKYFGLQNADLQDRIGGWFERNKVDRKRLKFLAATKSMAEHLRLYRRIDIALDTHPYNGTTTTCESLWMGVPVVLLNGDRHSSRVGASLLYHAGVPELVAANKGEYVAIACNLASDRDRLMQQRHDLRDTVRVSKLMDEKNFVRNLEKSFQQMLRLKVSSRDSV